MSSPSIGAFVWGFGFLYEPVTLFSVAFGGAATAYVLLALALSLRIRELRLRDKTNVEDDDLLDFWDPIYGRDAWRSVRFVLSTPDWLIDDRIAIRLLYALRFVVGLGVVLVFWALAWGWLMRPAA